MNAKEYRVVILVLQLTSYGTLEVSSMEQHVEKVLVAVYSQNDENLEQNESQPFWSIFSFIFFFILTCCSVSGRVLSVGLFFSHLL